MNSLKALFTLTFDLKGSSTTEYKLLCVSYIGLLWKIFQLYSSTIKRLRSLEKLCSVLPSLIVT